MTDRDRNRRPPKTPMARERWLELFEKRRQEVRDELAGYDEVADAFAGGRLDRLLKPIHVFGRIPSGRFVARCFVCNRPIVRYTTGELTSATLEHAFSKLHLMALADVHDIERHLDRLVDLNPNGGQP